MVLKERRDGALSRQRVRDVIAAFVDSGFPPTVREIAVHADLSRSQTHRILRLLEAEGIVKAPARRGAGWRLSVR